MRGASVLLGLLLFFSGCIQQGPVCNRPYIPVGGDCCLDENGDGICDRESPATTTIKAETPEPTTTLTASPPSTVITITTTAPTTVSTSVTTTVTTTSSVTSTTLGEIVVIDEIKLTSGYAWIMVIPKVVRRNESLNLSLEITNDKNSTFHFHLLNDTQYKKCNESVYWNNCINGVIDLHSIRSLNESFYVRGDWAVTIKNVAEAADYKVKWRFINPPEYAHRVWSLWNTDTKGCLHKDGKTCGMWDFIDCYGENLSVCDERCCRLSYQTKDGREIYWYQKCYSNEYLKTYMDVEVYTYSNLEHDPYVWFDAKYKDNNCAELRGLG